VIGYLFHRDGSPKKSTNGMPLAVRRAFQSIDSRPPRATWNDCSAFLMNSAPNTDAKLRILIADDDETHADAIRRSMENSNFAADVAIVRTLCAYRESVAQDAPDIALLDLNLRDGRAIEVLTSPPEAAAFPVLIMTSFGDERTVVEVLKAGALDYVVKSPEAIADLPRALRRSLREWQVLQERSRAEAALRMKTEELDRYFALSPDLLCITDTEGRFRSLNPEWQRLLAHRPPDLEGKSILEFTHPDDQRSMRAALSELAAQEPVHGLVTRFKGKDGSHRWIEWHAHPLGNLVYAAARDITERHLFHVVLREKNVQLQKALRAKDRFLATISHELRTPLNAIIGFVGLLLMKLSGPLTCEQEKQLQTVQSSARHLLLIINDLLDLARIEAGKVEMQRENVCCGELLEEVAHTLHPLAEKKGLKIGVQVSDSPVMLLTDRRFLSQILINLLNNAVKFTEAGSITASLTKTETGDSSVIRFTVADTGIGIPRGEQAKVFSEFARVARNSKHPYEGTGLGLHLSQKLATLLGGRITFESEPNKGSVFTLTLDDAATAQLAC
jgi:PAS domain S-box-containing protein